MTVTAYLTVKGAEEAIEFYTRAFGAAEKYRIPWEGRVGHAEIELAGEVVMLATPNRDYESPATHRRTCDAARRWLDNPWVIDGVFVEVDDVEAHHARAVAAGATILRGPEEPGVGYRIYTAEDLEGHRWMFGQPV